MITMIAATSRNRVIGIKNTLPWDLKEDLRYFREKTLGHAIVMGRKTFESIGRPLPHRTNIVLTTDKSFVAEGVKVIHSVEAVFDLEKEYPELFIIGGGQIYELFLPFADQLLITCVDIEIEGDVFFPEYTHLYTQVAESKQYIDEKSARAFKFTTWEKVKDNYKK